jgi:nicotinate-nucleotide--dimethylbenzimidazole phosphoribosyltransferase
VSLRLEERLDRWIRSVPEFDAEAARAAADRQSRLTKPPGSLGRLEEASVRLAGILGAARPVPGKKAVIVCAGDHGVAAEGVSAYPQEVTAQMVLNFLRGGAAINVLARHAGAEVAIVDMGVASPLPQHEALRVVHIADGTANIARGPAMTREQALAALVGGGEVALELARSENNLLAFGDMGIANTTPSAAIIATISGRPVEEVVGHGTGVEGAAYANKVHVVRQALEANAPDPTDALDVLTKVGGFEIAGLAGAMLAAATCRAALVIDGVISTAAALIAAGLQPRVREFMIASHRSVEPGHRVALGALGLEPLFDFNLRLGEGTGAVLAFATIEAAAHILNEMATFEEAGVSDGD